MSLIRDIESLSTLGDNALMRRMAMLVLKHIDLDNETDRQKFLDEVDEFARIDGPVQRALRCPGDRPRPHTREWDFIHEFSGDDKRRSVFVDLQENVIAHLRDLYTGRLDAIEFRGLPIEKFKELEEVAKEAIRGKVSAVSIVPELFEGKRELVHTLRVLADEIEGQSQELSDYSDEPYNSEQLDEILTNRGCSSFTETNGGFYRNSGREYVTRYVEKKRCCSNDGCCGNPNCSTSIVRSWERVTWRDGDPGTPPPTTPPPFQQGPWNNRIPVFTDPSIGQQSSDWGWRTINGNSDFHGGIDLTAPPGTNVQSVTDGEVVAIFRGQGGESGVVVRTGNRTHTYFHIDPSQALETEAQVRAGDRLGGVSERGRNTHLHYAIHEPPNGNYEERRDENSVDPLP